MKKATILVLIIVYLGSILIVGIFGMRAVPFEEIVYVEKITPTSVTSSTGESLVIRQSVKVGDDGVSTIIPDTYYIVATYEEGLTLIINYNLTPADCTNKNVKITIIEPVKDQPASITDRGEIVFSQRATIHLIYKTEDSATGPQMDVWIYFK